MVEERRCHCYTWNMGGDVESSKSGPAEQPRWVAMARRLQDQADVDLASARENMGHRRYRREVITSTTFQKAKTQEELLARFARILQERYGATLYLYGSQVRGTAGQRSDYDLVAVSDTFRDQKRTRRVLDRFYLWLEAGGWGQGLDLHCFTPEEFHRQTEDGLGYLGRARQAGELKLVRSES